MRFVAALAAVAAIFIAVPAAAQGGPPPPKPVIDPLEGVGVEGTTRVPIVVPADPENTWVLDLSTGGRVSIRLRPDAAPKMVEQIKTLTRRKFYDGVTFHRVIDAPESMAQGGDPTGTGGGESDLPDVPAEFNNLPHARGAVSAARTQDPNSANSQFFIMFGPRLGFDHDYTVFGRVIYGMEWVDKIERGEPPANPTRVLRAYIASDNPPPYQAAPAPAAPALPPGETKATLPQ
ncbi:peptidylprolyl isomerase [Sphingomonas sp. M1-B02]|uniref:peptidylprolyl isomerase n=1 Tax=Sphingomonas sp. M1-B02 TaxID=3114300 RepID=UPI00223F238A|nr:peptidylprolyl isomerase [Sphingomonas sp. S6-11]UZK67607.1 peptidylprolyl isomerase [Sphingomonas sp. S6-11]